MKYAILLHHLCTGDNFTMFPVMNELAAKYHRLYIFVLPRNLLTVQQLVSGMKNITLVMVDVWCCVPNIIVENVHQLIMSNNHDVTIEVISTGSHNPLSWANSKLEYYRTFYQQAQMDWDTIRYKYQNLPRCYDKEGKLLNDIRKRYGEKYIFIHDHRIDMSFKFRHPIPRQEIVVGYNPGNLPIFHPNFNYYLSPFNAEHHNKWTPDLISNCLMDYCSVLENATEIHINDSSFCALCPYLDLSRVKVKRIVLQEYTKEAIMDYHRCYQNWDIQYVPNITSI